MRDEIASVAKFELPEHDVRVRERMEMAEDAEEKSMESSVKQFCEIFGIDPAKTRIPAEDQKRAPRLRPPQSTDFPRRRSL